MKVFYPGSAIFLNFQAVITLPTRCQFLKQRDNRGMKKLQAPACIMPVVWSINLTFKNSRGFGKGKEE